MFRRSRASFAPLERVFHHRSCDNDRFILFLADGLAKEWKRYLGSVWGLEQAVRSIGRASSGSPGSRSAMGGYCCFTVDWVKRCRPRRHRTLAAPRICTVELPIQLAFSINFVGSCF